MQPIVDARYYTKRTRRVALLVCLALCLSLLLSAKLEADASAPPQVRAYSYTLVAERPHHPSLFTQGLLIHEGHFYESSGLYGKSRLVRYPVASTGSRWAQMTGRFSKELVLDDTYFAEGLTRFNDRLYLLTWKEQTLLVINPEDFTLEKSLSYRGEGWGLTHNEDYLIRSDGSHRLYFHKPEDFTLVKALEVREGARPVFRLNELEMINGKIWANIWYENRLVEIDPHTGQVIGSLDVSSLAASLKLTSSEQVLNGIAYDAQSSSLWITGKLWPKLFQIKLIAPSKGIPSKSAP